MKKPTLLLLGIAIFVVPFITLSPQAYADCSVNFSVGKNLLRPGSKGQQVQAMQSALNTILGESLVLDGVYEKNTKGMVMRMQTTIGTKADGIVGPQTAQKINEFLKKNCSGETPDISQKNFSHQVKTYTKKEAEIFLKESLKKNNGFAISSRENIAFVSAGTSTSATSKNDSSNFSSTNIQEQGVDESDIVKTDGKYIYTLSGKNIDIVQAAPEGKIVKVSTINLSGDAHDMYLSEGRLVVMMHTYEEKQYPQAKLPAGTQVSSDYRPNSYSVSFVRTAIYNIANPALPVLERTYDFEGSYTDSRIVDGYLYLISQKHLYNNTCCTIMPVLKENGKILDLSSPVAYFDMPYRDYVITQIHGISLKNPKEIKQANYLLSGGHMLYASDKALYLSYTDYQYPEIQPFNTSDVPASRIAVVPTGHERSVIHKIEISKGSTKLNSTGFVPGSVINQFAFSEHKGNLRVATTLGNNWNSESSKNNIYVLDGNLKTIGKIEGLAPGERIYSVRYIGNKAYMVTFKDIDPLFVIDLSNPTTPKVLGELKIPGFSSYLHPYSENLLIGVGQDTKTINGRTTTTGLKVSLFDVSNSTKPREVDSLVIGTQSSSEALYNHKAFLFSPKKNLLVVPFQNYDERPSKQFYGSAVFSITENKISLRGKVSHGETNAWESSIRRNVYIGDYLYTLSQKSLQSHDLKTLGTTDRFQLSQTSSNGVYPGVLR